MRKSLLLKIIIFNFVLILFLISCAKKKTGDEMILRLDNGAEPQTIDPVILTGHPEGNIVMQIFEGLTVYDPKDLSPKPGVAERWQISKDRKVYTFYLRTNAKWSDGTPITAETFEYSWLRALAPETAAQYAYQLWYIKNAKKYTSGKGKPEDVGIEVINKYTLKVTLENPTPFFMYLTAFYTLLPAPEHIIKKVGNDKWYLPENIICNGPFKLIEWKPQQHITLVKNETYWDKLKVKLDKIIIFPIEDKSTALEMFLNNEIDFLDSIPTERMDEMKKYPETMIFPISGTYYYKININANKALADPKVRKALALTINRNYIIKYIAKLNQTPAYSFVPLIMPGYKGFQMEKENSKLAKKLLTEAGYPDGKGFPKTTILYNTLEGHKKIAETIQQMWKKELNILVNIENHEWKVFLDKEHKMAYDIIRQGWNADYTDPNTFLDMFVTGGGNNNTGWGNPKYDNLIYKAKYEINFSKRMKYFYEAEKILITEQPIIPIYYYVIAHMLKPYVKGYYPNILDQHPLKEVYIED